MSGLCRDCKHYKTFEFMWEDWWQWQYDDPSEMYWEWAKRRYGACNLAESNGDKPEHSETKAIAIDGEQYTASLMTAPDFGCNQFESE